ncbi:MAG: PAS domain S-box protein [Bacteroidota bacterium]|nr:PAS domain S-box protein [Bacteroidota bacterium]
MSTLLAIDDRADNLVALKALLRNVKPEYRVITALSGAEGVRMACEEQPDVILLDISMPEMDGFEVCELLKGKPETRHIPIILLTAYHTDAKSRVYGLEQGAEAFLSKPIDEGELVAQVNAMLRLKEAEDHLRGEKDELEQRVRERTKALEQSRRQYQFLFDFAPDIYCTLDSANRIVSINQYGASYLGYDKQEVEGRSFLDFVADGEKDIASSIVEIARGDFSRRASGPFQLVTHAGNRIWVALRANVPQRVSEEESEVLLILHDVTEEQKVLTALHDNERQLRTLYENLSIGIYRSTLEGKIIFANPALLSMLRCESLEELQSGNLQQQFAYDRNEFERIIERYNSVSGYETRIRRNDGSWIDVRENAVVVPDEAGETQYYEGTLEDITEKVRTEKELLVSERRFRLLTETAKDAILGFDERGRLLLWNRAAATLFYLDDRQERECACETLFRDLHRDDLFRFAGIQKAQADSTQVLEMTCMRSDGSEFPADLTLSEIESFDRVKVFAIVRDISQRKKDEREREEALRLAREALRVKDLFIANMSHEIRTPLNAMLGFISLLQDALAESLDDELEEYFRIVQESGSRLLNTVHHILDLSRIESGGITRQRSQLDMVQLLESILKELQPALLEKRLTSGLVVEDANLVVHADRYMITQAISNIVENAIKYSERGGVIVRTGKTDDEVYVSIKDSGIGIGEDFFPRLFAEFTQESEGYTKKYQGLGLGLALAKRYTELNDGRIEVESAKHRGSTFTLYFPSADALVPSTGTSTGTGMPPASPRSGDRRQD